MERSIGAAGDGFVATPCELITDRVMCVGATVGSMSSPSHPTREKLIAATVELLDGRPGGFLVEDVLTTSGVSKGSMYHHFEDFQDLLDHADVRRYARFLITDADAIEEAVRTSSNRAELRDKIAELSRALRDPSRIPGRFARMRVMGRADLDPRLRSLLQVEQDRIVTLMRDVLRTAQDRGLMRAGLDPEAVILLMQGWALGQSYDHLTSQPLPMDKWSTVSDLIIDSIFGDD